MDMETLMTTTLAPLMDQNVTASTISSGPHQLMPTGLYTGTLLAVNGIFLSGILGIGYVALRLIFLSLIPFLWSFMPVFLSLPLVGLSLALAAYVTGNVLHAIGVIVGLFFRMRGLGCLDSSGVLVSCDGGGESKLHLMDDWRQRRQAGDDEEEASGLPVLTQFQVERLTEVVLAALRSQECSQRLLCEAGLLSRNVSETAHSVVKAVKDFVPDSLKESYVIFAKADKCEDYACGITSH